ncbi:Hypothetical predicted protein [Mytilus galloprovincialis]|uniref:Uncharacterized protein n=1 Tax=Mytilus galloprovincialis TaxID=29158 RepID=A0A8B6BZW3_MYTGA|nr:Hypothetical predicted protein [Mytilus galloprovincialis]
MSVPTITQLIKDKRYINNDSMEIEIILEKVNPVPNCSAWFQGRFINDATTSVMKWYTYHNDVKVIYNFPVDSVGCEGRLQILCNLVYRNVSIFDEHIDICHGREVLFIRRCWTNGKTKQSANINQDPLLTADTKKQEKERSPILNV